MQVRFSQPEWVERVTSTNSALIERLDRGDPLNDGYVLAAREQTAGRGRGQRQWQSQPGRDLCCSLVLRTAVEPSQLSSLSIAVSLGVAACLEGFGVSAQTKWPNDVIVDGRKIAGILPELPAASPTRAGTAATASGEGATRETWAVVVGIGVNVGMSAAEAALIDQPATSLLVQTGVTSEPERVLTALLPALTPWVDDWETGGFAALRPSWEMRCAGLGERVTVVDGNSRHTGILTGFGDAGQLHLDAGSGTTVEIWSGHLLLVSS